jgi:hypothetical protein
MLEERLAAAMTAVDPRERAALAAEAGDQLAIHVAAEEEVFGPVLRARSDRIDLVDDHGALKDLLADLTRRAPDDPAFGPLLAALRTQVERHHADEEALLFPGVARSFDADQRETMGRDILAYQKKLLRAGQPRCATRPGATPPAPLPALVSA